VDNKLASFASESVTYKL